MRKAARGLVAVREESFASPHALEESVKRLRTTLPSTDRVDAGGVQALRHRMTFEARWVAGDPVHLAATFTPTSRTPRFLQGLSVAMAVLVAACAWAFFAEGVALTLKAGLALVLALAVLGVPFVTLKLASDRAAEEQAIARAIRRAFERDAD